ncbi:MAG: flippase-like domain-containing protein [Dehalococcoidia bacterium]|nr:MAG: flippase-like domain-containing protein [Dehalococcoidia bacterium]
MAPRHGCPRPPGRSLLLKSRGFWIGIAISVVLILLFVRSTPIGDMKRAFEDANPWIALASLPVYFLGLWVRTIRWQYLLRPVKRVTTIRLFPVVIIGLMANNLIPARAGELARAYVLGQREKISKTTSLGTIAVDRLFDGVTLVPMMLIVAAFAGGDASFPVGFGKSLNFAGLGIVMAVLFGIAIAVLFWMALSERGRDLLHRLVVRFAPARVKPMVEGLLHSFFDGLGALRSPIDLGIAWLMSLISWTLEATMYYIVARAFGIDEPFYVFLLLTAAANLAIAIVASQGGIGPFEIVVSRTIVAFGTGIADSDASAYALGLHAMLLIPIVAIGLALMWSMDLTLSDMLKSSRETEAEAEALAIEEDAAARTARPTNPIVEGSGRK